MRAVLQTIAAVLILVATAAGSGRAAAVDPAKAKQVKDATAAFAALAKDSARSGQPPRQSDAKVDGLLTTIFETGALGRSTVPIGEVGPVSEWMAEGNAIGLVYLLAGTGAHDASELGDDQAKLEKVDANTSAFAPEIGRWIDFDLHMSDIIADTAIATIAASTPAEMQKPYMISGLGQIRQGFVGTLNGALQAFVNVGMTDDWRRARLPILVEAGARSAKLLEPDDAGAMRDLMNEAAGMMKDKSIQDRLRAIAATMAPKGG